MIKKLFLAIFALVLFSFSAQTLTYSTNFMWINKKPNKADAYVFPDIRRKAGWDVNIQEWIMAWLKANREGNFVFWYDKNSVSDQQIVNTQNLFSMWEEFELDGGKIELKDIRETSTVTNNWKYFSDKTPIYLRLDLLRIAIGLDYINKCQGECAFIYADIDKGIDSYSKFNGYRFDSVPAGVTLGDPIKERNGKFKFLNLSKEGLFDSTTMENLKKTGFIMRSGPENSFFILSSHQPTMIKALDEVVIKSNFKAIDDLAAEEAKLRKDLPTKELKEAPLDMNLKDVVGFGELTPEQLSNLRDLIKKGVGLVYDSMIRGNLMQRFDELKGGSERSKIPVKYIGGSESQSSIFKW